MLDYRKRVVTRWSQHTLVLMESNVKESVILKLAEMGIVELAHGYNPSVVTPHYRSFPGWLQKTLGGLGIRRFPTHHPLRKTSTSFSRFSH